MNICAIVPVYRHVRTVGSVVDALLERGLPVVLVDDGNTEADARALQAMAAQRQDVQVLRLERNGGKGAAIQRGLHGAAARGFSHALQLDADGQHDVADIDRFVALARQHPRDLIHGVPVFDSSVPRGRLYGRYLTHVWVWINTLSLDIRDSMCGFRVYPLEETMALLRRRPLPPRMAFDTEVMVRLHWRGVGIRGIRTRVVYPADGVSHFRIVVDNLAISWMHTRLFFGMLLRLPLLLARKFSAGMRRGAHWASIGENTWVGGITFLLFVHRWLGRWPFRLAVFPLVLCNWLFRPAARRASREYLQRIHAHRQQGRAPGPWSGLRHMMRFAETVLDKLLAAGGRLPVEQVRTEGREALYEALATGRGAVIVTAHMGCLELCQHMAELRGGTGLNILTHTRHAEKFNRVLRRLNPSSTAKFWEVTDVGPDLAMRLAERVDAGECVIIAGDRVPLSGGAVVPAPFLGHTANFPVGPYVLAGLFRVPLFFLGCIREGAGYVIHFDLVADGAALPRAQRNERLAQLAARYSGCLEALLARSPLDWFNFFDFWEQGNGHTTRV